MQRIRQLMCGREGEWEWTVVWGVWFMRSILIAAAFGLLIFLLSLSLAWQGKSEGGRGMVDGFRCQKSFVDPHSPSTISLVFSSFYSLPLPLFFFFSFSIRPLSSIVCCASFLFRSRDWRPDGKRSYDMPCAWRRVSCVCVRRAFCVRGGVCVCVRRESCVHGGVLYLCVRVWACVRGRSAHMCCMGRPMRQARYPWW